MNNSNIKPNENIYDVVVIGAGNGGLIAATTCVQKGLKTLLIEQHNLPGGFASSFVRGRFEFEIALHELGNLGNQAIPGGVYKLFQDLNINIDWKNIPEAFCLVVNENGHKKEYKFDFGIEQFINSCEGYEKGVSNKVKNFLTICEDCYNAVQYIIQTRGNPNPKILKKQFPNYLTVINYSIREVLQKMKFSKFMTFVLESYWIYLGVKPSELAAVLYCIMFYEYIKFKAYIPANRSHEISQTILNRFEELNGDVWFNTKALTIDIENNKIIGLNTTNGYVKTNHIISNISPHLVYGNMIDEKKIPNIIKKLNANREPGQQGFCVYLGLNKSVEELGLDSYSYFIFSENDHELVANNINSIDTNNEYILVALNVANPNCSEKGTSILSITTLYNDAWNNVNVENYFNIKNSIAKKFINDIEKKFNINIINHIEEIEIATPVTFARYTGSLNGAIYGYKQSVHDSNYIRSRNSKIYDCIKGLRFCGAHSMFSHGYSITYISGNIVGLQTLNDIKGK